MTNKIRTGCVLVFAGVSRLRRAAAKARAGLASMTVGNDQRKWTGNAFKPRKVKELRHSNCAAGTARRMSG